MMPDTTAFEPLSEDDYTELHLLLDDLRTRDDETPQWEFFEGALAALACCRRKILPSEYLPVLLNMEESSRQSVAPFADQAQLERFFDLWLRRMAEIVRALRTEIDSLDQDGAYLPLIQDLRGAVAGLPEQQRAEIGDCKLPALGQIWAIGFMFVVENWPEEWVVPRALSREVIDLFDAAMQCIVDLTDDDPESPAGPSEAEPDPMGASERRQDELVNAVWAVYDLHDLWRDVGPRIESVHRGPKIGRNDPCSCGSGKKYKKCCGAG